MEDTLHWLTPRDDLSEDKVYQVYKKRLEQIFDKNNRTVRNVAVVGDLGSGKSSLLRTYSRESKGDFMFISLVALESCVPYKEETKDIKLPDETTDKTGHTTSVEGDQKKQQPFEEKTEIFRAKPAEDRETVQKRLECSILRQVLSYCTREDLRYSALKAIPEAPKPRKITGGALLQLVCLAGLCFGLLFEDRFGAALRVVGFTADMRVIFHALGLGILFLFLFELGHHLWKERKLPLRLEKLTLKSGAAEAEITPDSQQHCLDLYKFEMVHILEQIAGRHGNTVIFEDMERFAPEICVETMTKLWELNQLLNTHLQTLDGEAAPVRFVYMIGDKVLSAENRVKYFDVVLPVLPSLNNGNFIAVFREKLKEMGVDVFFKPMRELIELLNPYLTDHRMMLSALNEFSLLRELYEVHSDDMYDEIEIAGLLAFAVCKTRYPEYCEGILAGTVSDELPDAADYPLIQALQEKVLLTKTGVLMSVYPWRDICAQWIKALETGTDQEREECAQYLRALLRTEKGEAKLGFLHWIGFEPQLHRLLLKAPSWDFADALSGICELIGNEFLDLIAEASGPDAFCGCLVLWDKLLPWAQIDAEDPMRQLCMLHLSGGVLELSEGWSQSGKELRAIAAKILTDPGDAHLLDNLYKEPAKDPAEAPV